MSVARRRLGKSGIEVPAIIFGSSALGNLYREIPRQEKRDIVSAWISSVGRPVAIDSAGKYGAGLALEMIGDLLGELGVPPEDVIISNKLGWKRVPLSTPEPQFEPGAWFGLSHDAVQTIDRRGIESCWHQGCELLGSYKPSLVSVHDPDEYLAGGDRDRRLGDIVDAYSFLSELRDSGDASGIGVGSKDWRVVRSICDMVDIDWVMLACSLTIMSHDAELLAFLAEARSRDIGVINSAVFHSGFLTGGAYYDYRVVKPEADSELFAWRDAFFACCREFDVAPADACVEFGLAPDGVAAVALNTSRPSRVADNVRSVSARAPDEFWNEMKRRSLIDAHLDFIGT